MVSREAKGAAGCLAGSGRAARRRMEERIGELGPTPGSRRGLEAEERCALKALRGDFTALPALATAEDRAEVSAFEGAGGRATEHGEEDACDRQDRAAVRAALRAARGG